MSQLQNLREQRAAKAKSLQDLVGKPVWDAAADQPVYDSGMAEIASIDAQIANHVALNEAAVKDAIDSSILGAADRLAADNGSEGVRVYAKWLRGGDNALTAEDHAAIRNTMSTTTASEGGYTVATEVAQSLIDSLKAFGGVRNLANVLVTTNGNPINFPTSDGTAEQGEILAENAPATGLDISLGVKPLPVYKYSSKTVAIPIELLMDSAIDIEAYVNKRLTQRLGRITNAHFTTGTGTGQPNGFVTAASVGKVGATGKTVSADYDDLTDLVHSVDSEYREAGNCKFAMNDLSVANIKKLKDTTGRPIFVPGYDAATLGALDRLLGYAVQPVPQMAEMGADAKSIGFGDFDHYQIRDALDVQMHRFTDSAYASKGQVGFLAFLRSGGNLLDAGAVKLYQNSAT
jgi:HK97 family phage major capsid protein